jgi:hypothetical protein
MAVAFPLGVIASHQFSDVPNTNIYHADIDALADAGVTTGCGDGTTFCPSAFVTREQMAAFMNRLGALGAGKTPVVNATKLDGLESTQFARSDVTVTGHFPCAGFAMDARSGGATVTAISNGGKFIVSGGTDRLTCNVTLPDGATVVAVRGRVFDNSATGEASCSLNAFSAATGAVTTLAATTTTGVSDVPGSVLVEDVTIDQSVIDNQAFAYAGQCGLTSNTDQLRLHGLWIEYTTIGLPVV